MQHNCLKYRISFNVLYFCQFEYPFCKECFERASSKPTFCIGYFETELLIFVNSLSLGKIGKCTFCCYV